MNGDITEQELLDMQNQEVKIDGKTYTAGRWRNRWRNLAKEVAEEVIFMDEGMIIEKADTKEFFANPKSDRTKLFLSQIL